MQRRIEFGANEDFDTALELKKFCENVIDPGAQLSDIDPDLMKDVGSVHEYCVRSIGALRACCVRDASTTPPSSLMLP